MRKKLIYSILAFILIGICTYRYLSLNQDIPNKVMIEQHLSGDSVDIEGNIVTVKYEISDQPYREKDKKYGFIKGNKYVKIHLSIKNNSNKELDPMGFLLSQDLRKGNNLHTAGLDKIQGLEKIPPNQSKTYIKFAVLKKDEQKYGAVFVLPPTFNRDLLSKEEQKQKLLHRHEWVFFEKKI